MSFPRNKPLTLTLVLLAGMLTIWLWHSANAFDRLDLSIQHLAAEGWRAEQLQLELNWPAEGGTGYRLEIGSFILPALDERLTDFKLDCLAGEISDRRISCQKGKVTLEHPLFKQSAVDLNFELEQQTGRLSGRLANLTLAAGRVDLEFSLVGAKWSASLQGRRLDLASVVALLPVASRPPEEWSYSGWISGDVQLSGEGSRLQRLQWRADLSELAFSDPTGASVGEGLAASANGQLVHSADLWQLVGELSMTRGELLTPYFYLNPHEHPVSLKTRLSADEAFQHVTIHESSLLCEDLLNLSAQAGLDMDAQQPLQNLLVEVQPLQAGEIYQELLQPVLFGTAWDRFELAGEIELSLSMEGEGMNLDIGLQDLHLDDADSEGSRKRLGLYGVNGRLHWSRGAEPRPSWLAWQAGHLLEKIDLGASRVDFEIADEAMHLIERARLPVLDGALVIERLDIEALGDANQKLAFDGMLTPISMNSLSEALGWPPLAGKLSGVIPGLTYENGVFNIDGVLLASIFDGDVLIRGLRVQDLFGVYPQLNADIEITGLDLEALTRTFSFGRITGRLDGHVRGLSLEAWQPVTFDALFYTPENDDSRHRISQKAVDNISNLGGAGLSGSLARSFLGVFEEFRYKRIGIGCRLQDQICEMVGVGEAKEGYYLVEGSGIPRIDIIGYNHTADWTRLVDQLKQITKSGGPVIQ